MSEPHTPEARDQERRKKRKKSELSFGVTALGLVLLLTPLINAFTTFNDTPSIFALLVYLFSAWAILILGAFIVSRILVSEVTEN